MKARLLLVSTIIAGVVSGCYDIEEGTPDCMVKKIKEYGNGQGCDDRSVGKYEFQGGIIYVMSPGTCGADMGADVFDDECNLLGMLGGFAGNTKINGDDFSEAVFIETVWKKN
jgi:hypothetical protein